MFRARMNCSDSRVVSRRVSGAVGVAAMGVLLSVGCSDDRGGGNPEDIGVARIAITRAPSDVYCARVTIAGRTLVQRSFPLVPGDSTVFTIGGLPIGDADFSAEAFLEACPLVGTSAVATWISDVVRANVPRGTPVDVTLQMKPNGRGTVGLNFPGDDPDGGAPPPGPAPKDPFALGEPAFPSVKVGDAGVATLGPERARLLAKLNAGSRRPARLTIDSATGIVLIANIDYTAQLAGQTPGEKALSFLREFQPLFDPRVLVSELLVAPNPRGCGTVVALVEREVKGLKVFGSRYTFHFGESGQVAEVVNGVAPAPGRLLDRAPAGLARVPLAEFAPPVAPDVQRPSSPVLIPAPDGTGLVAASLVTWPVGPGVYDAAVTIGADVVAPAVLPGRGRKGLLPGAPRFHTDTTSLADHITYRNILGVATTFLPGERNPVEAAYRFMEEHPSLLRTGSARCQFGQSEITESKVTPGAQTVRMEQRYVGLPVPGAEIAVGFEQTNRVMSIAGHTLPIIAASQQPAITTTDARARAAAALQGAVVRTHPEALPAVQSALAGDVSSRLVVFPDLLHGRGRAGLNTNLSHNLQAVSPVRIGTLAYEVRMGEFKLFVDAEKGAILYTETGRHADNVVTDAQNSNEFGRILGFTTVDVNGVPTGALPLNVDVVPLRTGLATVAAGLASLGWNGVSGGGGNFTGNTNVAISNGCLNAFFDTTFTNEAFFCLGMAMDDVVGHEFIHGVIAHSSGLVYQDESGAMNEAYADLFGNLFFPDSSPPGGWLIGEATARGTLRDMQNPGAFGQPGHISGYRSRDATCDLFPWSCDSGFVHTNSGIINRAHFLLINGVAGGGAGIGRAKMLPLAFFVMTERLTPNSRLNDVPMITRDVCDMFVSRGVTTLETPGVPYTVDDCDQIFEAFDQVGLNPTLSTGWSEPEIGFEGTDTFFAAGETTATGCNVANVTGQLATLSGFRPFDLDPATPMGPSADWVVFGANFINPPSPIGTTSQVHAVHWFNIFGFKPSFATQVIVSPPPAGEVNCLGVRRLTRFSAHIIHPWSSNPFGGGGNETAGNPSSGMNPACQVVDTKVQVLGDDGTTIPDGGPSYDARHVDSFLFFTFEKRATILGGPRPLPLTVPNLSVPVRWSHATGQNLRYRLVYTIEKPVVFTGDCQP